MEVDKDGHANCPLRSLGAQWKAAINQLFTFGAGDNQTAGQKANNSR
jgi:hypothetical protein